MIPQDTAVLDTAGIVGGQLVAEYLVDVKSEVRRYDLAGKTWVYVSADPLTFVRGTVEIDTIKGDNVYLSAGPPAGTKVLVAGVPQVFGAEVKVGH